MSKYKVGDKVVMEITDRFKNAYGHEYYSILDSVYSTEFIDEKSEPLRNYTEPLEAKIRRQAAEITRLLRENKELKNEKQELTRERNQLMGRCGGLSAAKIKAFNNGRLMSGVTQSGLVFSNEKTKDWHKTGRHIDVDSFLKQIGEE